MNELGFLELIGQAIFGPAGYAGYQQFKRYHKLSEYLDTTMPQIVAQKQQELDNRTARERTGGHNIRQGPLSASAEVRGVPLLLKFWENNDYNRVDVYYGGQGAPDGPLHGHIILKRGQITEHRSPGIK